MIPAKPYTANRHERRWVRHVRRGILVIGLLGLAVTAYIVSEKTGSLGQYLDKEVLRTLIENLGPMGPVLVIALMTVAIVMSPIPSAPIALAAGAAYGHLWGTVYVAAGSLSGALIAFGIARFLGRDFVEAKLKDSSAAGYLERYLKSQNALMATVFATRLMPFLSFDVISYAAGLTSLATWRFAVATVAGIIPASFLLAHFGSEIGSADPVRVTLAVLSLGVVTLVPVGVKVFLDRRRRGAAGRGPA